jgi:hypothetical protein
MGGAAKRINGTASIPKEHPRDSLRLLRRDYADRLAIDVEDEDGAAATRRLGPIPSLKLWT